MASDGVTVSSRVQRVLRWWPPLFALWMLFVGEWSWLTGVWGAGMALIAAAAADLVVSAYLLDARGRWRWCRELGPAAVAVLVDFGIVVHVLVKSIVTGRRRVGVFLEDAGASGQGPLPTSAGLGAAGGGLVAELLRPRHLARYRSSADARPAPAPTVGASS